MELLRRDPVFVAAQFALVGKIAFTVFVFDPIAADTFTLVKSTGAHAASLVLLALLLALAVRHGSLLLTRSAVAIAVAGLVAVLVIATPFSMDQTTAMFGVARRYLGLTQVLDNALVFVAAMALTPTRGDLGRLALGFLAVLMPVLVYALVQLSGNDPIKYEVSSDRPFSTLGQVDVFGGFLAIWVSSCIAVLMLRWRQLDRTLAWTLIVLAAFAILVIRFNAVRNTYLGVAAAAVVVVALRLAPRARPRVAAALLGLLLLVVLGTPGLAYLANVAGIPLANDPTVTQRLAAWEASVKLVLGRPMLGLGPDNFAVGYRSVETLDGVLASLGETINSTHNWFFYFATSAGLLGAAASLAVVLFVGFAGWRLALKGDVAALALVPFAAYLGQGVVDVNDIALDPVFWAAAGAIAATAPRADWSLPRPMRGPGWSIASAAILVALALAAAVPSFSRVTASETFKTSLLYATEGNAPLAIEAARISTLLDPRRAEYWNAFGGGLAVSGNANAAATAFADAAARAPWEPGYQKNIALQKVRTGDFVGAQLAIQRALALDPYDADSLDIEARFTFNRGDFEGAARLGELAVKIHPVDVPKYEVPAQAYFKLKRYGDAETLLIAGLARIDDPHLHVLLALAYIGEGRRDAGLQELDRALAIAPTSAEALAIKQQLLGR